MGICGFLVLLFFTLHADGEIWTSDLTQTTSRALFRPNYVGPVFLVHLQDAFRAKCGADAAALAPGIEYFNSVYASFCHVIKAFSNPQGIQPVVDYFSISRTVRPISPVFFTT